MTLKVYGNTEGSERVIIVQSKNWKEFQELVQRGANLWPDASPDIKMFADIVTVGKPMQDYHGMYSKSVEIPNQVV